MVPGLERLREDGPRPWPASAGSRRRHRGVPGDRAEARWRPRSRDAGRHMSCTVARWRRRRTRARVRSTWSGADGASARRSARRCAEERVRRFGRDRALTGTTHVSVIDDEGNAAALSSTLGSGSGEFSGGFQLNNMLGELDVIGSRRAAAGRAPAEHDGADSRPRRRRATARRRERRIGQALGGDPADDPPRRRGGWVGRRGDRSPAAPRRGRRRSDRGRLAGRDGRAAAGDGPAGERWAGRNLYFGGVSAVERRADGQLAAAGDPRRGGHGMVVP